MSKEKKYIEIVKHYEECLDKYGDSHLGVDWPRKEDAEKRYKVMLEVIKERDKSVSVLDFGCGAGHLKEYIDKEKLKNILYSGLDISEEFIKLCRQKFPGDTFYCMDVLEDDHSLPTFDYIVMNGVFTEKRGLTYDEMLEYFKKMIQTIFQKTVSGLAFNVMSKHVDWEREDLFHLPHDTLAEFLTKKISRNYVIRNDYGLYEYTTYIYK